MPACLIPFRRGAGGGINTRLREASSVLAALQSLPRSELGRRERKQIVWRGEARRAEGERRRRDRPTGRAREAEVISARSHRIESHSPPRPPSLPPSFPRFAPSMLCARRLPSRLRPPPQQQPKLFCNHVEKVIQINSDAARAPAARPRMQPREESSPPVTQPTIPALIIFTSTLSLILDWYCPAPIQFRGGSISIYSVPRPTPGLPSSGRLHVSSLIRGPDGDGRLAKFCYSPIPEWRPTVPLATWSWSASHKMRKSSSSELEAALPSSLVGIVRIAADVHRQRHPASVHLSELFQDRKDCRDVLCSFIMGTKASLSCLPLPPRC